ncbi:hypothetical protein HYH03_007147 [Edaphochlamys debaryana]|uniref:Uncharacterized protein n=1 Tax=Edaphochlamys debaryana TaxID=47281 RepID=A0A835Y2A5_9CHLO|nr:hypothetical protein HYH03_007147 [Edaphochlamys debaryana]|eukprot:KAG2494628.1 hypothetical protein HYH03_007147 [Edaphochlamys debaryana]
MQRVKACHNQAPAKDRGPEAAASTDFAVFYYAVSSIFTSSLLFEHWARLVLALACCEGTEEETASGAERLGLAISSLTPGLGFKAWSPPVDPGLTFLLASHLVTLAAVLDGGPTFGLPPGPAGGAVPSGAQPGPALPLADTTGGVLRTGPGRGPGSAPARITAALPELDMWAKALGRVEDAVKRPLSPGGDTLPEPFRPPPLGPPPLCRVAQCARGACATAVEHAAARMTAALVYEGEDPTSRQGAVPGCGRDLAACTRMQAALDRGDVLYDWAAAFEVGMRLAGGAAVQLCGQGAGAGAAAFGPHTEAALRQLHAPAAWRGGPGRGAEAGQPPAPTRPPARRQAAPLLEAGDAKTLVMEGLGLARTAVAVPEEVYNPRWGWQGPPPPWLRRRLAAWWRAALAWAQEGLTEGWREALRPLPLTSCDPGDGLPAQPSPDLAAALCAGYLPAIERLLRNPRFALVSSTVSLRFPVTPDELSVWSEPSAAGGRCAEYAQGVAALVRTQVFANAFTPGVGLPAALVAYPGAAPLPEGWPVVMSSVAARLLMPVAAVVRDAAACLLTYLPGDAEAQRLGFELVQLTTLCLAWVPSLVAAAFPPLQARLAPGRLAAVEGAAEGAAGAAGGSGAATETAPAVAEGSGLSAPREPEPAASCAVYHAHWGILLSERLCLYTLLGIALEVAKLIDEDFLQLGAALVPALWALVARAPAELAALVTEAEAEAAVEGTPPGLLTRVALRGLLGPGGRVPEPALLAAVERVCEEAARAEQADAGAGASGSAAAGPSGSAAAVRPSGLAAAARPSGSAAAGPSGAAAAASPLGAAAADAAGAAAATGDMALPEKVLRYAAAPLAAAPVCRGGCNDARLFQLRLHQPGRA